MRMRTYVFEDQRTKIFEPAFEEIKSPIECVLIQYGVEMYY